MASGRKRPFRLTTGDGSADTGDLLSYGDTGLHFNGILPGIHTVAAKVFVDTNGVLTGPEVQSYLEQPLQTSLQTSLFADGWGELLASWYTIPPGSVTIIAVPHLISFLDHANP
jgi:hypothetical protein